MTMELSDFHPNPGSRPKSRRLGRGQGSGRGKTAGKGTKGQQARAGARIPAFFEGGQNSFVHRMPVKRGLHFKAPPHDKPTALTLRQLASFTADQTVDLAAMIKAKLVSHQTRQVKIIDGGSLNQPLNVTAYKFSAGARAKIEAAGGTATQLAAASIEEG